MTITSTPVKVGMKVEHMSTQRDNHHAKERTDAQQHSIKLYVKVWAMLFVLSTMSYLVDYVQLEGYLRWSLVLLFMFLKAGLILSVFMHFAWESFTLKVMLLLPLAAIVVGVVILALEGDYTFVNRMRFLSGGS